MKIQTRRLVALVATPLLAGALVATPSTAQAAEPTPQATAAAGWLATQLTNGVIHDDAFSYDDYGTTIDALYALKAVGGFDAKVGEIVTRLKTDAATYATSDGARAKLLGAATVADESPTDFGGVDLVAGVEAGLYDSGANDGRLKGQYSSPYVQSYAVQGLDAAGSDRAEAATEFLLSQQCTAGFFRSTFTADLTAADQSCDGAPSDEKAADTDNTAQSVLALLPQDDDTDVQAVLAKAKTWLLANQAADGSFIGSAPYTAYANADSTGLAAQALEGLGEHAAAAKAASWIVNQQAVALSGCTTALDASAGAIAPTPDQYSEASEDGVVTATAYNFRKATADAAAALLSYEASTSKLQVSTPSFFVSGGSTVTLKVSGLNAGERFCLTGRGASDGRASSTGTATVSVKAPTTTLTSNIVVEGAASTRSATTSFKALPGRTLPVAVKYANRKRNAQQLVTVSGLSSGEKVRLYTLGKTFTGTASGSGTFTVRFAVGTSLGTKVVRTYGQFDNRAGESSFRVVK